MINITVSGARLLRYEPLALSDIYLVFLNCELDIIIVPIISENLED